MAGEVDGNFGGMDFSSAPVAPDWTQGMNWSENPEVGSMSGQYLNPEQGGATAYDPSQISEGQISQATLDMLRKKGFTGNLFSQVGGNTQASSTGMGEMAGRQQLSPEALSWMKTNGIKPSAYASGDGMNEDFNQGGKLIGQDHIKQQDSSDWMLAANLAFGGMFGAAGALGQAGTLGNAAGNAGLSAGRTLGTGGSLGDAFKSAATGGAGAALGGAVNSYNPADSLGVPSGYQDFANKAIGGAGSSLLAGQSPTRALVGAGLGAAGRYAGGALGDNVDDSYFQDGGSSPAPMSSDQQTMQGIFNPSGANYSTPGGASPVTGMDMNTPFTGNTAFAGQPQQKTASNPFMDQAKSGILSAGNFIGNNSGQFENLGANLLDMYNRKKQMGANSELQGNLSSLYGPNSPYAQQLQQTLLRSDAAAGRRSQVGTRSVELQARLADLNSRNAPTLNTLNNQQGQNRNGMLQDIYRLGVGGPNGGGLGGMAMGAARGMNNYFNPQAPNGQPLQGNYLGQDPSYDG